jgi:hypothetical protein
MIRGTTDAKRRVMTQPLVLRNHKLLHRWFAMALFLTGALASSGVTAAIGEQFCTHGGQDPQKGDSVACYSDAGCRFAASAEPKSTCAGGHEVSRSGRARHGAWLPYWARASAGGPPARRPLRREMVGFSGSKGGPYAI